MHISKLWVSIAQIANLRCGFPSKTVIASTQITLLVFPFAVEDAEDGEEEDADLAAEIDCVARGVARGVFGGVGPGGEDAARGAERDDVGGRDGADGGSGGVVGGPCHEAGAAWEGTDGNEEDSAIAGLRVRCPAHDAEAGDGGDCENGEVDAAAVRLVRGKSYHDGDDTGTHVGRN